MRVETPRRARLREVVGVMVPWYVRSFAAFGIVWALAPRAHRVDFAYDAAVAVIWLHCVLIIVDAVRLQWETRRIEAELRQLDDLLNPE